MPEFDLELARNLFDNQAWPEILNVLALAGIVGYGLVRLRALLPVAAAHRKAVAKGLTARRRR